MSRYTLVLLWVLGVALASSNARANLVVDGGFEAATDIPGDVPSAPWVSNDGVVIDNTVPHSGSQDAAMGNSSTGGPGTLSQLLPTVAGQNYILDFWVFDEAASPADSFSASLGTFILPTITGDTTPSYTEFTATVPSIDVGSNATLSFSAVNAISDWNLDDVSVTPVAVPAPVIGRGLPIFLALGGMLFGAWFLERSRSRRLVARSI